jgi:two-component system, OmpR family, phosphate regulon sensor histidine kinase PhoR
VNRIYARTAINLAVFAGVAWLAGLFGGAAWGWATFALGSCGMLLWHVWHLSRLSSWVERPASTPVPEGHGSWDQMLSILYRHERDGVRREELLAQALTRFRLAAQALPDGVVILDHENRIEWCNDTAAAQLGLDPRADAGQPIANLVREPAFIEYLAADDPLRLPPLRVPFGGNLVYALHLIPYGEAQKLLLSRDVTQAERLETMRRDFVANVSHELRTPLTVLVGFLETIRELKLDPQRTRDYLGMMQEQSGRMHRIIEDLLTLSVLESAPPPPGERIRIKPLLERVRSDAEALSGGRHKISLQAWPAVDILGSEAELASAFVNLVTNAIRYTPQGGEVNIVWRDGPEGSAISVEDTGIGIAPDHLPRLTERFYRVDRSRSRESGGTGLGLAIVKHAVARHQATLEIDSRLGSGSRFSIRFPAKRTVPAEPQLVK